MPVIDARCEACGVTEEELVESLRLPPPCCPHCGGPREKALSLPMVVIPAWMTDSGMASNARHREWLKTAQAKAMSLDRVKDCD